MESPKLVNGDLVIDRGEIVMIGEGVELTQSAEVVLGTNKGEWFLNPEMGIDFSKLLGKGVSEEAVRQQVRQGLTQEPRIQSVDSITVQLDTKERSALITFVATGRNGERVEGQGNPGVR